MLLHELTAAAGANKRPKRVGRGEGSGHGKTCGRGTKGCYARAGGGVDPLYEGGQMPLFMRVSKRGFSNFHFRTEYEVVNLADLAARFSENETVDAAALLKHRLVRSRSSRVKILGVGALKHRLKVEAHAASESAKLAIEKAGGSLTLLPVKDAASQWRAKRGSAKKAAAQKSAAK